MTFPEVWRLSYSIASGLTFLWLLFDLYRRADFLTKSRLFLYISLAGYLLATCISSIESFILKDDLFIRTPFFTAALVWCILGLWVSREDDT